ncbi:DUF4422 domain-containing protein [Streptococcus dentapri]|uniref:DUF4422 domain-containing protein n=1 Tax=Streptococcus dentapri TaxID=573564 RepID=A0ABV8D156_9STRE
MKNIKLIVATHKKFVMPYDMTLYLPVHVGAAGKSAIGYTPDNTGDNISELNPYYSELTGLYWAWKNLDADYVGLVHYRRYFAKHRQGYREGLDINQVILDQMDCEAYLEDHDVIVPKKRKYYIETLYSHYAHTMDGSHLDKLREIIQKSQPTYLEAFDQVMKQRSGYMFNMYLMSKENSDAYCTWLFPILEQLYQEIDTSRLTAFEARLFGRVSEILFNVWLKEQGLKVKEVPFIYMEKVNLWKKGSAFLMAKFFGKKYGSSF